MKDLQLNKRLVNSRNILLFIDHESPSWINYFWQLIISLRQSNNICYNISVLFYGKCELPEGMARFTENIFTISESEWLNFVKRGLSFLDKLPHDLSPDIIIGADFREILLPHIKNRYPHCLTLFIDSSIFTRAPFPPMHCLDPVGIVGSYLSQYWHHIEHTFTLDRKQTESLLNLKVQLQNFIRKTSPFHRLLYQYRQKFNKIILVCISLLPIKIGESNFSFVEDILKYTPSDTGVIVSFHPYMEKFNEEQFEYLAAHYKNFIYNIDAELYQFPSQYLLAHVDGVILNYSTIAFQTLLWDVKLLSIHPIHKFMSNETQIEKIPQLLYNSPSIDKNKLLFWFLTRYSAFSDSQYIFNTEFFTRFIEHGLDCFRAKNLIDFYQETDSYEVLFNRIIEHTNGEALKFNENKKNNFIINYDLLLDYIRNLQNNKEINMHSLLKDKKILIYGMGTIGNAVYQDLVKKDGINYKLIGTLDSESVEQYQLNGNECVIVTPIYDYEIIEKRLRYKGVREIINLQKLLK